jgi:hypothetical protein
MGINGFGMMFWKGAACFRSLSRRTKFNKCPYDKNVLKITLKK